MQQHWWVCAELYNDGKRSRASRDLEEAQANFHPRSAVGIVWGVPAQGRKWRWQKNWAENWPKKMYLTSRLLGHLMLRCNECMLHILKCSMFGHTTSSAIGQRFPVPFLKISLNKLSYFIFLEFNPTSAVSYLVSWPDKWWDRSEMWNSVPLTHSSIRLLSLILLFCPLVTV